MIKISPTKSSATIRIMCGRGEACAFPFTNTKIASSGIRHMALIADCVLPIIPCTRVAVWKWNSIIRATTIIVKPQHQGDNIHAHETSSGWHSCSWNSIRVTIFTLTKHHHGNNNGTLATSSGWQGTLKSHHQCDKSHPSHIIRVTSQTQVTLSCWWLFRLL